MESSASRSEVAGEGGVAMLTKPTASRPKLTLPPRNPAEVLLRTSEAATPSPMTFVSSLFAEQDPYPDCKSFSQLLAGAMASPAGLSGEGSTESGAQADSANSDGVAGMPTGGRSFAERLAARGPAASASGRSNTARFKAMTPSRLPIPRSPLLTIPPGFSPTTLLDSPVLLPTGQAEPSPTTGSFRFAPILHETGLSSVSEALKERSSERDGGSSFVSKPQPTSARNPLSPRASMALAQVKTQAHAQAQLQASHGSSADEACPDSDHTLRLTSAPSVGHPMLATLHSGPLDQSRTEPLEKVSSPQASVPGPPPPHLVERPSEDGYNWRKYGQKQVKGSEYPRSYYKCTSPNCSVKKKVERSYDGQITEIVYKGEHDHPKPQATRRSGMSGAHVTDGAVLERADFSNGVRKADSDRSSADPSSSRGQLVVYSSGLAGTPEPSLGSTSDDEGEDGNRAEDGEEVPESKRRRIEKAKETLTNAPLRTIREPRVVVQTTSEVDILDDGYRWRKYGQKVVKGNPHPRSYYKCTNFGCSVRKHVERSSTDPRAVITTYEGKHNHDVPAARNSNHDASGTATSSGLSAPGPARAGLNVSVSNTLTKPSPSLQEQLFGKLFEDRLKAEENMVDFDRGSLKSGALAPDQNRDQGGTYISAQSARSLMGSVLGPLEDSESYAHRVALRPKEEPGDVQPLGSSLQPVYPSSSFAAQRLLSGP